MSPSVEPFDEAKYKALMDGLNIVEISFFSLRNENPTFRIDSNFFDKIVLQSLSKIQSHDHFYIKRENIVNGPFGSTITTDSHLENGFIPLVRSININQGFYINDNDLVYISEKDNAIIKHSQLNTDDIILSRVGSIGFFARVDAKMGTCNISSNNIGIKLGDYPQNLRHYILSFLNTQTAFGLTVRRASGNVQPKLTVDEICRIAIPSFSSIFYDEISLLILESEKYRNFAYEYDKAAHDLLSNILGLNSMNPSEQSIKITSIKESFCISDRLDAEYYQPKYDDYLSSLQRFETTRLPVEFDVLKNAGTNYAEGISDVGVIKTKQLTNSGVNTDGVESYFTNEVCAQNKSIFIANNDVIFASMGVGSLGKVSLFSYDGDKSFATDSTLRIYRAKETTRVLPEVLCIFLQSKIGQELIYRYVVGSTGIINIYDDDVAKIPIPVLDAELQKDIAAKVQESFALRRQSKQLLEYAKQAVEMAIEQGENAALAWLKDKVE